MHDTATRLTLALIELDRERAARVRAERSLGEAAVQLAEMRLRLDKYEPRPEPEISTFGT